MKVLHLRAQLQVCPHLQGEAVCGLLRVCCEQEVEVGQLFRPSTLLSRPPERTGGKR